MSSLRIFILKILAFLGFGAAKQMLAAPGGHQDTSALRAWSKTPAVLSYSLIRNAPYDTRAAARQGGHFLHLSRGGRLRACLFAQALPAVNGEARVALSLAVASPNDKAVSRAEGRVAAVKNLTDGMDFVVMPVLSAISQLCSSWLSFSIVAYLRPELSGLSRFSLSHQDQERLRNVLKRCEEVSLGLEHDPTSLADSAAALAPEQFDLPVLLKGCTEYEIGMVREFLVAEENRRSFAVEHGCALLEAPLGLFPTRDALEPIFRAVSRERRKSKIRERLKRFGELEPIFIHLRQQGRIVGTAMIEPIAGGRVFVSTSIVHPNEKSPSRRDGRLYAIVNSVRGELLTLEKLEVLLDEGNILSVGHARDDIPYAEFNSTSTLIRRLREIDEVLNEKERQ